MSLGIVLSHAQQVAREDREVRTDHAAFVGIVPQARWPRGAKPGDFLEIHCEALSAFEGALALPLLDAATRMAVRSFFANGGARCSVFGVCILGQIDLEDPARVPQRLAGLLERLTEHEEQGVLVVPPLAWLPIVRRPGFTPMPGVEVVRTMLRHCRTIGGRVLLLETPRDATEEDVAAWAGAIRAMPDVDPSFAALYYPWLMRGDQALPPAGAVAGLFARSDRDNGPLGVRAAPANLEVRGFTHAALSLGFRAAAALVEVGVNPVIEQAGRGLVLWGARTLSGDPKWQHLTSRRIVNFVTERVRRDAEWVVFEHMRPELWETLARMVRSRLDSFWAAGLLTGEAAGSEYVVQCDEELNPPAVRDAGQVHFKVLLRPVATTEFIEIELQLGA